MNQSQILTELEGKNIFHPELKKIWIEEEVVLPTYIRDIKEFTWEEFSNRIKGLDLVFYRELVRNLLAGDVFVLKNAVSFDDISQLKKSCITFSEENDSSFHQIVDGSPDFFREANTEAAKKYGFYRCNTLFYFHRWNNSKLFKIADKTWDIFKVVCGWNPDAFKDATPSDGFVDRLHIHLYPPGIGEQEAHQDPYLAQKIIMGHALSSRGEDYSSGGIYYVKSTGEKIDVDSMISIGDAYISFPTLVHGVEKVACEENLLNVKNMNLSGRWFMGFYTLWSDVQKERHTGIPWNESNVLNKDFLGK